jgi:chromosome segregation ATPase
MRDFMKQKEREKGDSRGEDSALEEEQKLRKRVSKGAWGIAKDKANIHLSMEKVQSYEEAFAKIQKATKITDIDELVQTFISAEDQNFSLFNYVTDKSNEIERLEEQIATIKAEIVKYQGTGNTGDNKRKKIIEDLSNKLNSTATKADKFEDKYATASKTIEALKKGIQSVFDKIGFNDEKVNEILGNSGVTESNMMQYLGVIEQRVNELLQIYILTKDGGAGAGGEGGGEDGGSAADGGGDNLDVNLPQAGYADGDSEEDEQGDFQQQQQEE